MKKLIIAEKPSLGKNIATALYVNNRKDGYIEGDNYIITWSFGHLLELKRIKDYLNIEKILWKNIALPFIPNKFEFILKSDEGVKKQFTIIENLIKREDVSEIINCGDADREGQLVVDLIIQTVGINKTVKRLWLPEQTEETIRNQLNQLEDNEKYINLYNEGIARTYLDWLLGINLTMYLTVKSGKLLRAGRVLVPIVKFIYDKDLAIKNFDAEIYYQIESKIIKDDIELLLTVKDKKFKENEIDQAKNLANLLNKNKTIVKSIEIKEKKKLPSKLFSLSTLQSFLSKNKKMNFADSLEIIQSLYQRGYITYPRTNSEYLSENEKEKVKALLEIYKSYELEFKDSKKIFDDTKIESHSAIIITSKVPKLNEFEENEKIVYEAIFYRFISNFLKEDTIIAETVINIGAGDETFELKGETLIQTGYLKYEPIKIEKILPNFSVNEELDVNFKPKKKKTQAPKKATEEDLANYLKNPFRSEKMTEDEEYKAIFEGVEIGTEATRTNIIENAKENKYISQKRNTYSIEPLGEKLIEILDLLKINLYKERTVEFSKLLKKIYKNEASIENIMEIAKKELVEIISSKTIAINRIQDARESVGKCPICGSDVIISKKGDTFYCSNNINNCKFVLFEKMKIYGTEVKITKTKAKSLLKNKNTVFKLRDNVKNSEYEAYILIDGIRNKYVQFKISGFPEKK
ncbi:MAG: DNA topoisomerase [Fusobacteriaceae bacterium]|jgi:DNA topoisomerase-3|nr:DNA topoisomerase [Fusobacteriaceae bacterium]